MSTVYSLLPSDVFLMIAMALSKSGDASLYIDISLWTFRSRLEKSCESNTLEANVFETYDRYR